MKNHRITFQGSLKSIRTSCGYCGACVDFGGFGFIDAETEKAVCEGCVAKYAPELLNVPAKAEEYAEQTRELMAAHGETAKPVETSDDYEHEKAKGRLSVYDGKVVFSNDNVLVANFTLNFRGLEIPGCELFNSRTSGLCFGLPLRNFEMCKVDRDELTRKLSGVVDDIMQNIIPF
jgi:hypothetical protein